MSRFVWPAFADYYRIVIFDHVGCGESELAAYDPEIRLSGRICDDLITICRELGTPHGVVVGHSVSATIGAIASLKALDIFEDLRRAFSGGTKMDFAEARHRTAGSYQSR